MRKTHLHTRIIQYPFAAGLQGAQIESVREEERGQLHDLIMEYRAFERKNSELFERDGRIFERVSGRFVPMQIRFEAITGLEGDAYFKNPPAEADARLLIDLLSWQQPGRSDIFHLFSVKAIDAPDLVFYARRASHEQIPGESTPVSLERDWCPPPPMPNTLHPMPKAIHRRFGGDPVPVRINARLERHRLFLGGVHLQPESHPSVDFVLNLGEEPSKWAASGVVDPRDRWDNKGEGRFGMSPEVIRQEAEWVIERLKTGQRGLVHCVAGMNRSTTICCAVLMFLEGISAEAALARVRETHPMGRPDSRHWLALRWLEKLNSVKSAQ